MSACLRVLTLVGFCAVVTACGVDEPGASPSPLPIPAPVPPSPPPPTPVPPPGPAIPLPPGAPPSTTTLSFTSEPGDYIGQGLSRTYYLGDGTWSAFYDTTFGSHVGIRILNLPGSQLWWWDLDFAAPRGQMLTVGTYEGAARYPFQPNAQPGLTLAGTGRGCNQLTGRFVVSEIQIGPGNTVDRLVATFDQNCEGRPPTLRGRVVIASDPWR